MVKPHTAVIKIPISIWEKGVPLDNDHHFISLNVPQAQITITSLNLQPVLFALVSGLPNLCWEIPPVFDFNWGFMLLVVMRFVETSIQS